MRSYLRKVSGIIGSPRRLGRTATAMWVRTFAKGSSLPLVGRTCTRLAVLWLGPYKARRRYISLTGRSYVSPRAEIHCVNLKVGKKCFIDDSVTIYGVDADASIELGDGVRIHRGSILEVAHGGRIRIGANTSVLPHCLLTSLVGSLVIGKDVLIAPQCAFFPYDHRIDDSGRPIREAGYTSKGGIVIQDDVWLGVGVKVMDGVRIGRGAVIGAASVVTRDVPDYAVAVGSPARVVRHRTAEEQVPV
jgi:acetyltransferase-like isoleucine patch superfamily enzyme